MTTYTVDLSPVAVNMASDGSMDTSVVNGNSIQRTVNAIMVKNGSDYKMVGRIPDGGTFNDVVETLTAVQGIS
jgi:hypothetical protein